MLPTDLCKFWLKFRCNLAFRPLVLLDMGVRDFNCPDCSDQVYYWNLAHHALNKHHFKGDSFKEKLITLKKFFARCNSLYAN